MVVIYANRQQYPLFMKVRHQLLLLLTLVIAAIILLSVFLQVSITNQTRLLLQGKLTETKEKEIPKLLQLNAAYINSYNYDYSVWDQMVEFVTGKRDSTWAAEELTAPLANYKIDYIWVLDSNANKYYFSATHPSLAINALDIPAPVLKASLSVQKSRSFFVTHNNAVVEVFAGGITNTADKDRKDPPKGYFLLGRIVDSAYMAHLRNLSAEISFNFVAAGKAYPDNTNTKNGTLEFSIPAKQFDGSILGGFNISRSYPVLSGYQKYLGWYLFIFIGLIVMIGLVFYQVSKKILLSPLASISMALKEHNASKLSRYNLQPNEFGSLSRLISNFFTQNKKLEDEIETRKQSEADLQKALSDKYTAQTERIKVEEFLEQQQAMLQLNANNNEAGFDDKIKEVIALGAKTVKCERVGIWLYNNNGLSSINAAHIFTLSTKEYTTGDVAYEKDYPVYFQHLKKDAFIIANDALTHPATCEFTKSYLLPYGITSMLDVPIRSGNKVIGVVCCEHVGPKREWGISEQIFLSSLADIVALNFEKEERKKAEDLLKKNQIRFEETQELAHIGSWEFNFFTKEVVWSKEMYRIFDMDDTPPEKLFESYRDRLHTDDIAGFDNAVKQLIEKNETYSVESRVVTKSGEVKYILAIGETLKSPRQGKIIGLRGTVQDITKQKQSALAKSEFLSCMSHEIRTPINGVIGIANLLQEEELNERQQEYVKTLNFSAEHLSTVVSDILDFSKIESGHMTFEKVSFNLEKNCKYVFDLFSNRAQEKNIAYQFTPVPVKDYSLYGDYVRLNQVLSNLLSNAIKFTNKGSVELSYQIKDDNDDKVSVVFSIKDSGIGISEKHQRNVFESFTQANDAITRQYGGTGLGLTICKKLVELQGGRISVQSTLGVGSVFSVELTFDKHVYETKTLNSITTAEKNQVKNLSGMRVLVAEDNKVNTMVLTRFLAKWCIESVVAKNGSEAISFLENEVFDIVLMDIQMPVMDGVEATKIIREKENGTGVHIPIVAFTADASVDTHRQLLKIGFDHCMTKPFNPDLLFSLLKKNYNPVFQ